MRTALFVIPGLLAAAALTLALPATGEPPAPKVTKLGNATCPVRGAPVDPKITMVWNDLEIGFCTADCPAKFEAEPLKYVPALLRDLANQLAAAKAKAPASATDGDPVDLGNPKCPVMGGDAKPGVFLVYHGMKVHFCCPGCDGKFRADPDRYLRVLRADPAVAKKIDDAEAAWAARGGK